MCPGVKRRITDEHMAAEMNTLCLNNEQKYCHGEAVFNPTEMVDTHFGYQSNNSMVLNDTEEKR